MWVYLINQRSSCNISYSIQQIPIFCFLYETSRGLLVTELLSAEIFYFDLIVRETRGTWLGLTLAANALDYNRYYYHHQILEISLFCHTMGIFHPLRVYSNGEMRGERSTSHLSSCHPVAVTRSDLWTFKQSAKIISVMEWKWGRELLHFTLWIINHGEDKIFFVLKWHFPNRKCREETELTKSYNLQCHISAINCQNNKEPAKFIQNMLN